MKMRYAYTAERGLLPKPGVVSEGGISKKKKLKKKAQRIARRKNRRK